MEINGAVDPNTSLVRVEIGYCPRCGTLRAYPAGAAAEFCEACLRILEWMHSGWKRPRRRSARRPAASRGGPR
jgi:hypothetical protein